MNLLVIDAPKGFLDTIHTFFKRESNPPTITSTKHIQGALKAIRKNQFDAVVMDYHLLKGEGLDLISSMREESLTIPILPIMGSMEEIRAIKTLMNDSYDESLKKCLLHKEEEDTTRVDFTLFKMVQRSQEQWQAIIDAITDYIFVTDIHLTIKRVNRSFARKFNRHPRDMLGQNATSFIGEELIHPENVLKDAESPDIPVSQEVRINNDVFLISVFPALFDNEELFVHTMKDITEMKRLRDQIYQSDKLSSLGLLVSGIAHEINNPLTGVLGHVEILNLTVDDESIKKDLDKISIAAERCKKVIENLMYFSRQQTPQRSPENINDIIDRTIELRSYWLRKNEVEVTKQYSSIPFANVDSQQIQHAVLNILMNAEQAITESGEKGTIAVSTSFDDSANTIIIIISDNGPGIPDEHVPKIFDPFFSTRPVNEGKGLGLSIAYSIISDHRGVIKVESKEGKGTTFTIELPPL